MAAWREIEIEASPDEVWEALATEEGRERWLDEPDREIHVESADAPHRLVWWWWEGDEPADPRRVPRRGRAGRRARAGRRDRAGGAARPPRVEPDGRRRVSDAHRPGARGAGRPHATPRRRDPAARGRDERARADRVAAHEPPGGRQAPRRPRRRRPGGARAGGGPAGELPPAARGPGARRLVDGRGGRRLGRPPRAPQGCGGAAERRPQGVAAQRRPAPPARRRPAPAAPARPRPGRGRRCRAPAAPRPPGW